MQTFMEEMTRKQPDVDKVTKTHKRKATADVPVQSQIPVLEKGRTGRRFRHKTLYYVYVVLCLGWLEYFQAPELHFPLYIRHIRMCKCEQVQWFANPLWTSVIIRKEIPGPVHVSSNSPGSNRDQEPPVKPISE